jgi:hypothetical protein
MENENKLIAEFMGYKVVDKPKVVNGENFFEYIDENGNYTYCNSSLKYNTHWDWLMPVVNKIEDYLADNVGKVGYFDECLNSNDLEVRYQAVVEFIKTYKNK